MNFYWGLKQVLSACRLFQLDWIVTWEEGRASLLLGSICEMGVWSGEEKVPGKTLAWTSTASQLVEKNSIHHSGWFQGLRERGRLRLPRRGFEGRQLWVRLFLPGHQGVESTSLGSRLTWGRPPLGGCEGKNGWKRERSKEVEYHGEQPRRGKVSRS